MTSLEQQMLKIIKTLHDDIDYLLNSKANILQNTNATQKELSNIHAYIKLSLKHIKS